MASQRHHFMITTALLLIYIFYLSQSHDIVAYVVPWPPAKITTGVDWSRFAYTQYVTNSDYLCNSLMFFESLHRYSSHADRVMMVPSFMLEPEMVNSSDASLLNKARDKYNVKIVPITIQTREIAEPTWADSYTKLLAYNQTQYSRVLSIDSDSTLSQPMDELFFLPPAPVAMPQAYWITSEKVLSSQVMLIEPSEAEFARVMSKVQSSSFGEYDMEIVNELYRDSALVFPHRGYDLISGEFRNEDHTQYLGSDVEVWDPTAVYSEAKLIHFSDWPFPKPWKLILEDLRLALQPNCTSNVDGVEDCTARIIWNSLYTDFRKKRKEVCDSSE